jgi:hypothetical protein
LTASLSLRKQTQMMTSGFDGPHVIRVLGDMDGYARWVGVIQNYDTKNVAVEVLISIHEEEGIMRLATRPRFSGATWSPPIELDRS